jgi:hypothetical protein
LDAAWYRQFFGAELLPGARDRTAAREVFQMPGVAIQLHKNGYVDKTE